MKVPKFFNFLKKELGDRIGLGYRGATFGIGDDIRADTNLYYSLYRKNTDLRRVIEELYQTVGKDGYKLAIGDQNIESTIIDDVLNFEMGFDLFKARIIRDLQVAGNIFIINVLNGSGTIIGFQVLDPRTISIIANKFGEPVRYVQRVKGDIQEYNPDEIFHFKDSIDPDNEILGISKIETLVYDLLGDKEAGRSNYSFFKNNAVPSTIITLDNELDENEIKIALEQLKKQFTGGENSHRVSASSGIKDVKVLGSSMKDMEFLALRQFTTERVCSAMGVPKTILGYSDNVNFSTSDNQYRKYIENTIRPIDIQISKMLTMLIQQIDERVELSFIDNHTFDLDEKIDRSIKLIDVGAKTINELRLELGKEEYQEEFAKNPIIKQGYEPLDDVGLNLVQEPNKSNNANK